MHISEKEIAQHEIYLITLFSKTTIQKYFSYKSNNDLFFYNGLQTTRFKNSIIR